jgi:hypothetical protein
MTDCGTEAVAAAFRSMGIAATVLAPDARTLNSKPAFDGRRVLPPRSPSGITLVAEAPDSIPRAPLS